MCPGGERWTEEARCSRQEMYSYRILLGYGMRVIIEKKKYVLIHFQILEPNKKFLLMEMTACGKGKEERRVMG